MADRKIGEGHAEAMFRLGLREARAAFYPGSNIAQQSEYGLYGTATPGEVAEARRADDHDLEDEKPNESIVSDRLQQAKGREEKGGASKSPELEK